MFDTKVLYTCVVFTGSSKIYIPDLALRSGKLPPED